MIPSSHHPLPPPQKYLLFRLLTRISVLPVIELGIYMGSWHFLFLALLNIMFLDFHVVLYSQTAWILISAVYWLCDSSALNFFVYEMEKIVITS